MTSQWFSANEPPPDRVHPRARIVDRWPSLATIGNVLAWIATITIITLVFVGIPYGFVRLMIWIWSPL